MSSENHYRGAASEFLVAGYLSQHGYDVFMPDTPARADMIYTKTSMFPVRVQVKSSSRVNTGGPYMYEQVRLATTKAKLVYTESEIDELWVVGTHIWCFPIEVVAGLSSLSLLTTGPRGGSTPYNPEEYIVKRGSWENPVRDIFSLDTADAVA